MEEERCPVCGEPRDSEAYCHYKLTPKDEAAIHTAARRVRDKRKAREVNG